MRTLTVDELATRLTVRSAPTVSSVACRLLGTALCVVVAGCAAGTASPSITGSTSTTPVRAEDTQGQYELVFELPRTDWHASDVITGEATLSLIGSGVANFGSSGSGPLAFAFDEVGGSRHVQGLMTPDCRSYRLEAGKPISSSIKKSGVYSSGAPPSDFGRWFMTDPVVHLPAGDWKITAMALVSSGICPGPDDITLHAAVLVHVTA
jgi:hypothetical protein